MAKSRWGRRAPGWLARFSFLLYGPLARFLLAAAFALVPLVVGGIGLHEYVLSLPLLHGKPQYGRGFWDIVFYDLQLPVLSSAPAQGPGPYPVALGVARVLAPVVAGAATLGTLRLLLGEQWRRWSAAAARGHSVVTGDGIVALELARRLREENRRVVLASTNDDTLAQARRSRLLEVHGDPRDPGTLRAAGIAHAAELYACTTQGVVNAEITLHARDEYRPAGSRRLSAYALVRDEELGIALRARRIGAAGDPRLRLDFFDIEGMAARKLLDKHPLPAGGDGQASVMIVGFGQLGQAILREIARRQPPPPGGRRIEVVIKDATQDAVVAFTKAFPAIGENPALSYGAGTDLPATGDCIVFVCLDGADDAFGEGLAMAHSLAGRNARVVVCMRESSPLRGVLAERSGLIDDVMGRLSVFGVIQEACMPADIRDDFTEQIARAIHAAYVANEAAKGQTEATNSSMVPWECLPEYLRQSNIAQATDIGAKLEAIGAVVIPQSASAPGFTFTGDEIERLARMEHDRWMRERAAGGWKYGERRDPDHKLHPDLRDWAYLSEEAKKKDRNSIVDIPARLHDAGYQVLRLPKKS